jgi:uncharacterized membrane protein
LPLSVIALMVLLLALRYPTAPAVIPIHFTLTGQADRFATKSIWAFFSPVGMQLGVWLFLTLLGAGVSRSRMASWTGKAGEAYQHMWARLVFFIKTGAIVLSSSTEILATSTQQSGTLAGLMAALALGLNVALLALLLLLALRYGQSGLERRFYLLQSPRPGAFR